MSHELKLIMNLHHRHGLSLTRPAVSFRGGATRESGGNRA